jgi:F-type H+-transporting ATPase subunit a
VHGQVLLITWFVLTIIRTISLTANRDLELLPNEKQNFTEYITEFIRDIAKTQIGEHDYLTWVPFLGTIFLFIFVSNWSGALLPWHVLEIPSGELAAPTNDINTTVALSALTSIAYFYGGLSKKGLGYFKRYVSPAAFLLPINVLEDFTKPLSLSFRLFGNVLADELVVAVLVTLVPLIVPIPLILLGLFTSAIQALVFSTLAGAYIGEAVEEHHLSLYKNFGCYQKLVKYFFYESAYCCCFGCWCWSFCWFGGNRIWCRTRDCCWVRGRRNCTTT